MIQVGESTYWTRRLLGKQLKGIGLQPGDSVMVHAGMRSIGPLLNGPDALIGAVLDEIGSTGTLLCYVSWDEHYEDALEETGRLPDELKTEIPAFDPISSRASRDHGVFAEFVRTTPGARRSANPGAFVAAIGYKAAWFTAGHGLNYGYGLASPFAKLVSVAGKILLVGAPLDTVSILHHAEDLARIPGKRIRRMEVPLLINGRTQWRMIEEYDTADPVVVGLEADYFKTIVEAFLLTKGGYSERIGAAPSVLLPAAQLVAFAIEWLEQRYNL
jgi:aminoglycoside 3-N-acetyltransferase